MVKFEGFLKVYRETDTEETDERSEEMNILPTISVGEKLQRVEVQAVERFTQHAPRYNEASLVRKLEELGIGRPSTYAPTISTIQQREYVVRGDKAGEERPYTVLTLDAKGLHEEQRTAIIGAERGRLLPTDTGVVVNDFLMQYFPSIMDYNFTAAVEKEFDAIADGKEEWTGMLHHFWAEFEPLVEESMSTKTELRVGERVLGTDPASGRTVSVKIGRFGPVVQIGTADEKEKPRFAQLKKGQSIETLTLEDALELFRLPRTLGDYKGKTVTIGTGRYGNYVLYNKQFVSIPATMDPLTMTLEDAVQLINEKQQVEAERHLKKFDEDADLEVMNGRYGAYLSYKGTNYRLTKALQERAQELTYDECMAIVKEQDEKPKSPAKRRFAKRKA